MIMRRRGYQETKAFAPFDRTPSPQGLSISFPRFTTFSQTPMAKLTPSKCVPKRRSSQREDYCWQDYRRGNMMLCYVRTLQGGGSGLNFYRMLRAVKNVYMFGVGTIPATAITWGVFTGCLKAHNEEEYRPRLKLLLIQRGREYCLQVILPN